MKFILLSAVLLMVFAPNLLIAGPVAEVIEENDHRWSYSGYWRNSSQGQHGSGRAYAVGNAEQTSSDSTYSGEAGEGMAYLDLSAYQVNAHLNIELCFVYHTTNWRSESTVAEIHYSGGSKLTKVFSQIGSKNTKGCYSLGEHQSVEGVSLSNKTTDSKWVSLDYAGIKVSQSTDTSGPNYQSNIEAGDITPVGPMGTSFSGFAAITAESLGMTFSDDANFGKISVPIDDLDGNGVPELLVNVKHQTANLSTTWLMILFLDSNGNVLKYQSIDSVMTKDTSWNHQYEPYFMSRAGDFDGNGVKDVVMTENSTTLNNRFNILLFGKTDDSINAAYTVIGDAEISNNRGNLPFELNDGSYFGNWPHAVGDLDGNGVMDFWNVTADFSGNIKALYNTEFRLHMTTKLASDGSVDSVEAAGIDRGANQKIVGDMNADGIPDAIMLGNSGNQSFFLTSIISNGNSSSYTQVNARISKYGVANHLRAINIIPVGDANGDGFIDVIAAAYPDFRESGYQSMELIYLDGSFQQKGTPVTLYDQNDHQGIAFSVYAPSVVDMDNDGDLDIVVNAPFAPNGGALYIRYYD